MASNRILGPVILAIVAVCASLVTGHTVARADVEGPHITFSPHAGAAFWASDYNLAEDVLFGGRVGLMLGAHLGIEGTFDLTPTSTKTAPEIFNRVSHVGSAFVLNVAPYRLVNPYLSFGWSQFHFDPEGAQEYDFNGWEAGGGFKIRLSAADGKRVDLRLDARNVFVERDAPFANPETVQNSLLTTAGLQFSMGGPVSDTDADGVPDRADQCAGTPLFAIVDAHGCPLDTDADGVFNGLDRCPNTLTGALVNDSGCALDGDADGVPDGVDGCPNTPVGALVDTSGCPVDTDLDTVPDGLDRCPGTRARVTVDAFGCALDTDSDGVPDGLDLCAGTPAGLEVDPEGCPVVTSEKEYELLDTGMLSLSNVYFESGSATLKSQSYAPLEELGQILVKWPQLKIEVGGHTDSQGAEGFNQSLSEKRARSVLDYLGTRFPDIKTGQYIVVGYGEGRSIATNDTPDGRMKNRRVEFRVLNREVLKR